MDFLSHPNSTGQRSSPQSGGIPPASDAAVAAAPRTRLEETNYPSVGGGVQKRKHCSRGKSGLSHSKSKISRFSNSSRTTLSSLRPEKEQDILPRDSRGGIGIREGEKKKLRSRDRPLQLPPLLKIGRLQTGGKKTQF